MVENPLTLIPLLPTTNPLNVDKPVTFKFPPIFTLFSIPIPPSTIIAPVSLLVESVVSENVVIPVKVALLDPLPQLKFPLPSLVSTDPDDP